MAANEVEAQPQHKKQPVGVAMVTPAATLLATWGVRKVLGVGYHAATGRKLPAAHDREAPLGSVLLWTVVTTAAVAVAEVLVIRAVAHLADE
jgi:hypothetical protein